MPDEENQELGWDTEDESYDEEEAFDEHEATGGDLTSFWDCEVGWVKNVHLMSLDDLRKIGYPDVNANPKSSTLGSGEKPLGSTGLNVTPSGLSIIWSDLAESWNMSVAKVQRITICHGLCLWARDSWFTELDKMHRKVRKLMRGVPDAKILDEFTTSSLIYSHNPTAAKRGGSIAYLTNRLGMVAKVDARLGVPQTTALIELSIASIMTLKSRKLGRWLITIKPEYDSFRAYGEKRRQALEALYNKLADSKTNS